MSKQPFKAGDRVTSEFHKNEKDMLRTITHVRKSDRCQSGWLVSADGGDPCPCCKRLMSSSITLIDSDWFKKVKD